MSINMDGDFQLNKIGYYTPKIVEENSWLNDKQKPEDLAKFGKNYAVVFDGDAQTYLWTAKNAPEVGKRYWGHLQATSGKSIRFKTDKQEDVPQNVQDPKASSDRLYVAHNDDKEDSIARAVALKAAVEYGVANKYDDTTTLELAEVFVAWLKNSSGTHGSGEGTTASPQASQVSQNPGSAAGQSGYDKARQARSNLTQDPEVQSLIDFADGYNGEDNDN